MHIKGYKVQSPVYFTTKKVTISVPTRVHVRSALKAEEPVQPARTVKPKARKNTPKAKAATKVATGTTTV